jgi:signal transduction histidine kinase
MFVILSGQFAMYMDRGAGPRRTAELRAGDVSGVLPYSRLTHSPLMPQVEEPVEVLAIHRDDFPEMIRECYELTAVLVHRMVDRARGYSHHDSYEEKMLSLGRLAAGLAHELDNPASAALRSTRSLLPLVRDAVQAARAQGEGASLPDELAAAETLLGRVLAHEPAEARSPLEQARREEAVSDWLADRGLGGSEIADSLAETGVTLEMLDAFERAVRPSVLKASLAWVASISALERLVDEIASATGRVSDLVRAVKAFTQMDAAAAPGPVDIEQGLADTVAVMESKARTKDSRTPLP